MKNQKPLYGTISSDGCRFVLYFAHAPQSNNAHVYHCSTGAFKAALPDTPIIDFRPCEWVKIPLMSVNECDQFAYKGVSLSDYLKLSERAGAVIMPFSEFKKSYIFNV